MQRLITIINKVKEIDMDKITERLLKESEELKKITHEQYLAAIKIKKDYENQEREIQALWFPIRLLKQGDFVIYIGNGRQTTSKHLTVGKKYRLTCSPYRKNIAIINDINKRMVTKTNRFLTINEYHEKED